MCCQTAYDSFMTILSVVGGKEERKRGEEFLRRLTIVPDSPSARSLSLQPMGKITKRAIIIFGTGDHLEIPTVTANVGFVRAAEHRVNEIEFNLYTICYFKT